MFYLLSNACPLSGMALLVGFTVIIFSFYTKRYFSDASGSTNLRNLNNRFGIPTLSMPPRLTKDLTDTISSCR